MREGQGFSVLAARHDDDDDDDDDDSVVGSVIVSLSPNPDSSFRNLEEKFKISPHNS